MVKWQSQDGHQRNMVRVCGIRISCWLTDNALSRGDFLWYMNGYVTIGTKQVILFMTTLYERHDNESVKATGRPNHQPCEREPG
jgi:hypothetical protein